MAKEKMRREEIEAKWHSIFCSTDTMTDNDKKICIEILEKTYQFKKEKIFFVPSPYMANYVVFSCLLLDENKCPNFTFEPTGNNGLDIFLKTVSSYIGKTEKVVPLLDFPVYRMNELSHNFLSMKGNSLSKYFMNSISMNILNDIFNHHLTNILLSYGRGYDDYDGDDGDDFISVSNWEKISRITHLFGATDSNEDVVNQILYELNRLHTENIETYTTIDFLLKSGKDVNATQLCAKILKEHSGGFLLLDNFCVIWDRPKSFLLDDLSRPHNTDGPWREWRDDIGQYAVHGVKVAAKYFLDPKSLTVSDIINEENTEVRRVLMERYGYNRLLKDCNHRVIDKSEKNKIGILYEFPDLEDDEEFVVVQVNNSTPEPDGSIKKYWLRVPPSMRTAREAVAWTFGKKESEYHPEIET